MLDAETRERTWGSVAASYLPFVAGDSFWRFSRARSPSDPDQGWKLHISATILSAADVLKAVGPLLTGAGVLFKAPHRLVDLQALNTGLYGAYTQVGKFITVYPRTTDEAVRLADLLDRRTSRYAGPAIPFESPVRPGSLVHYRYGSHVGPKPDTDPAAVSLHGPNGETTPDRRDAWPPFPTWVHDPFRSRSRRPRGGQATSRIGKDLLVFEALSQRGKGGVYRALDLTVSPPRICVVKEGRRNGETEWDGRDGMWRVRNELAVLRVLASAGASVPAPYDLFSVSGHDYLVREWIDGTDLHAAIFGRRRRLGLRLALHLALQTATLLSSVHSAGLVWRDCKPKNLLIDRRWKIYGLDFEGACPTDQAETAWSTPGYTRASRTSVATNQWFVDDLFAFGVTIHQIFTSHISRPGDRLPLLRKSRPSVTVELERVIDGLVSARPSDRPELRDVIACLVAAMTDLGLELAGGHTSTTSRTRR